MQLYHGSIEIVKVPVIREKQRLLDFGQGFYTTTNQKQAERWALLKQKREGKKAKAFVSGYRFNKANFNNTKLKIKKFNKPGEAWLDFVVKNRNEYYNHGYDMVFGPVANDTLYQTLGLYEAGILTKQETITRLKVHPLYNQVVFNTIHAIQLLQFELAYQL
jgi:hypothetical protein